MLALLGVRVTVLDQTTMHALWTEGDLPGGGDLFLVTPVRIGDTDDNRDQGGITRVTMSWTRSTGG